MVVVLVRRARARRTTCWSSNSTVDEPLLVVVVATAAHQQRDDHAEDDDAECGEQRPRATSSVVAFVADAVPPPPPSYGTADVVAGNRRHRNRRVVRTGERVVPAVATGRVVDRGAAALRGSSGRALWGRPVHRLPSEALLGRAPADRSGRAPAVCVNGRRRTLCPGSPLRQGARGPCRCLRATPASWTDFIAGQGFGALARRCPPGAPAGIVTNRRCRR